MIFYGAFWGTPRDGFFKELVPFVVYDVFCCGTPMENHILLVGTKGKEEPLMSSAAEGTSPLLSTFWLDFIEKPPELQLLWSSIRFPLLLVSH